MNKQELIKKIKNLSYTLTWNTPRINREIVIDLIEQLDELQKPVVPQFVADWIEECKNDDFHLFGAMEGISLNQKKLDYWFREDDNMEIFARAWLDGYEVEEEKRYLVKVKGISEDSDCLNYDSIDDEWYFASDIDSCNVRTHHTRKELEVAGFGDVFDSPLFEIEEVE